MHALFTSKISSCIFPQKFYNSQDSVKSNSQQSYLKSVGESNGFKKEQGIPKEKQVPQQPLHSSRKGSGTKRKLDRLNPNMADKRQETSGTPPSSKQLRLDEVIGVQDGHQEVFFIVINFKIMKDIISNVGKCLECGSKVEIVDVLENRMRLSHKLTIKCTSCNLEKSQYSSSKMKAKATGGRSYFESNVRLVTAFREIGKGHQGIDNFSRIMNMHGLSWPGYENIKGDMIIAYENAATASMRQAAEKVHFETEQKLPVDPSITLCDVSIDGTWQKRGHASLNGAVTAICNGLCVDKHVMSKHCRLCQKWESKKAKLNMMSGNCSTYVRKIIQSLLEQWKVLEQLPFLHPLFKSIS